MSQPEYRLAVKIKNAIHERGMWCFKVHGGPTTMAGVPDLVGVYRGLFVGFEVKMPGGVVSDRQRYVMRHIMDAGGIVTVPRSVADALAVLDRIDTSLHPIEAAILDLRTSFADDMWRA